MQFTVGHVIRSLWLAAPIEVLIAAGLGVLVADLFLPRQARGTLGFIAIIGLVLAFVARRAVGLTGPGEPIFMGAMSSSYLGSLAQDVILAGAAFLALISPSDLERREAPQGEYYALLLFASAAMLALATTTELLTLFLNVELMSIALYVLTGIEKHNLKSTEAAFKYFILGSFSGAFLLMGIAFVFGATGETRYSAITAAIAHGQVREPTFLAAGLILMLVGFGFKLTLAPFHMYAPDVYEGAPTPVAAMIATLNKVAVLAALVPLVTIAASWNGLPRGVWVAFYAVALASMIVGNVGAVVQPNIKRMLAYSSIAHSGYAIVPLVTLLGVGAAASPELVTMARDAVAYYLMAYTVMTLVAFGVIVSLGPAGDSKISSYAGLWRRNPAIAIMMLLAMLSLLGGPGTIGFLGKLQLFRVAVDGHFVGLAIMGVLASVASVFYYLRVVVTMFMSEPASVAETPAPATPEGANYLALAVGSFCILLFFFMPALYLFNETR